MPPIVLYSHLALTAYYKQSNSLFFIQTCSTKSSTEIELPFYSTSTGRVSSQGEERIRHRRAIPPKIPIRVIDLHCIKAFSCLPSVSTKAADTTCKRRKHQQGEQKNRELENRVHQYQRLDETDLWIFDAFLFSASICFLSFLYHSPFS